MQHQLLGLYRNMDDGQSHKRRRLSKTADEVNNSNQQSDKPAVPKIHIKIKNPRKKKSSDVAVSSKVAPSLASTKSQSSGTKSHNSSKNSQNSSNKSQSSSNKSRTNPHKHSKNLANPPSSADKEDGPTPKKGRKTHTKHAVPDDPNKIIVLSFGSLYLRFGLASADKPHLMHNVVACCTDRSRFEHNFDDDVSTVSPLKIPSSSKQHIGEVKTSDVASSHEQLDANIVPAPALCETSSPEMSFKEEQRRNEALKLDHLFCKRLSNLKIPLPRKPHKNAFFETPEAVPVYKQGSCTSVIPAKAALPPEFCFTDLEAEPLFIVGDAAMHIPQGAPYKLIWPIVNGNIAISSGHSWQMLSDVLEKIILFAVSVSLGIAKQQLPKYAIALVIPDRFSRREIQFVYDLFLIKFNFGSVFSHKESVLSCFGCGVSSACVVDMGAQKTTICCVDEGVVMPNTCVHLSYGGENITELFLYLLKLFSSTHYFPYPECSLSNPQDLLLIRRMKEELATYSERQEPFSAYSMQIWSPDSDVVVLHRMNVGTVCNIAPLAFFNTKLLSISLPKPTLLTSLYTLPYSDHLDEEYLEQSGYIPKSCGPKDKDKDKDKEQKVSSSDTAVGQDSPYPSSSPMASPSPSASPSPAMKPSSIKPLMDVDTVRTPLEHAITRSIGQLPSLQSKKTLATQILLTGGSAKIPGLVEYLEDRLIEFLPYHEDIDTVEVIVTGRKGIDPHIISWKGAALVVSADGIKDMWTHRNEWRQNGLRLLRTQCPYSL